MPFISTEFSDLLIFEPTLLSDSRGYFYESYNETTFRKNGLNLKFVQDNHAESHYGVIRGLHYQKPPFAQTKLVRVLAGCIKDVVVDLRYGSPTYKKYFEIILTASNKKQLLVPKGFAHGYAVLSERAEVVYKCDEFYSKRSEAGITFNDSGLNINWQIPKSRIIVSEKDQLYPLLDEYEPVFYYNHVDINTEL